MILNIRDQGWKFKSNKEDFSKNGEKNYLSSIFSNLFSLEISSESWSEWVDLSSLKDHCKKKEKKNTLRIWLDSYQRFEAGQPLTQEWLDQLQVFFVHQEGRLHRKYIYRILCMTEMVYRNDPSLLIDICVPPEAVINICKIHLKYQACDPS